jgi:two-component system CheB/CheR fusion protein
MAGSRRKATAPPRETATSALIPVGPEAGTPAELPPFPIVGVGASAGGLEAFSQMLNAMPVDTGMAFVLVQHLSPAHASLLSEILSRTTTMPVSEVEDEPRVQPNRVYVIPPDRNMIISHGVLQLFPRKEQRGQHRPIDVFLRSLAEDQGHRAIGVILSGTATDGTLGLEAIKAEGGITFAQDKTAQQSGMPQSAIARGCVDFVLPPDEIAREIGHIARHPHLAPANRKTAAGGPDLSAILEILGSVKGVDFSLYKANTLYRRITRRMVLHKVQGLQDYARLLRNSPEEVEALYQDTLINVTRFFRNPETFEVLAAKILPRLLETHSAQEPLRIWIPGCSTGEEAYSFAITLAELTAASGRQVPVQIFGTDLNEECIAKARSGIYPPGIAADVSPERLERFFSKVDGSYRITKPIRDLCVFACHNLLTDPPFSQIDLVSCRNLLIYLGPELQKRVLPLLHYALKPAGVLLLGGSETIGSYRALFEAEDARHRIYTKKPGAHRAALGTTTGLRRGRGAPATAGKPGAPADVQTEADRILLARYAPPGVLVNADLEILQFRGDTGPYLAPAPGKASLNLLRMAREGLLLPLRAAIRRAGKEEATVREEGLRVQYHGTIRMVHLEVVPIKGGSARESGFLVAFEEPAPPTLAPGKKGRSRAPAARAIGASEGEEAAEQENARLTQELAATRDYLQLVIEQQEAAYEELQSATEEAQSANEELQSINEELETSKEEIESSNEELVTVNDELQHSNQELNQLNNDLINLLEGIDMAIVMLGPDLRMRRFTPAAAKAFSLTPGDLGRPVGDLRLSFDISDLEALLSEVIETASVREREVQDRQGRWYSLRIRPYRTLENRIEGAVILLVDVDTLRRARKYAENIIATLGELLLVLDGDLRVQTASRSFYETFQVTAEETEGRFLYDLTERRWDNPELRGLLSEVLRQGKGFDDFEVESELAGLGPRTFLLTARKLAEESGPGTLILLAIQDVTVRRQLEVALRQRVQELAAADRSKNEFLALLAHELRNPLAPLRNAVQVLAIPGADAAAVTRAREMLGRQVHNMARLIEDLLDISRINQGKVLLRKERVELATALRQAVELVQSQAEARGQELSLSLPDEPVELDADPTRLEQVFGNILSNASKFTPKGGHLWVTAELVAGEPQSAGEAVVRVRDDGIGIAPEALPHVFDLFMQEDRSLDRTRGGLGIGLTLVHRLVTLHGGSVEARSAGLRKGSEIVVRLPVLPPADGGPGPGDPVDSAAGGLEHSFVAPSPLRILVVDDNVDTAESLALLLRLRGHEAEIAHDGPAALDLAAAFEPDAVLLDIGLPGLDGYQVAAELRRQPQTAGALLVALTGYGQEEDQRRAREAGFDHHLTKPVDPQVIYQLLAQFPASERRPQ